MKIRILPPDVQQQIAAGEVIERPASVVKELIENALDASADTIRVEIQEGGRRLIKVTDNGPGMAAEDVGLACERFATSKITSATDIARIQTFGFRGEALPSIASVSRLRLLTRQRADQLGTEHRLEAGRLISQRQAGAPVGTSVEVWDVFYNTPARRRFMRSLRTEYGHILGTFTRFALAFPDTSLSLSFDGREVYSFQPGSLQERLTACFGGETTSGLEEVENAGLNGRVWGAVLPSQDGWRRRYYLFVNRRPIRNRTLYRAVRDAWGEAGGLVLLFLELHPSQLDVNIHPAKAEVRFRDDTAIYSLVRSALEHRQRPAWLQTDAVAEQQEAYDGASVNGFSLVGQVENSFLLTASEGHVYLLDQHAAEERVLYERLRDGRVQARRLIAPQVVKLSIDEQALVDDTAEALSACRFELDAFGPGVIALRAVPDFVDPQSSGLIFSRLLARLRNKKEDITQALSCLAALKAGQPLSREAQERLLTAWTQTTHPHACAHDRPVYFRLSLDEVRRRLGRTGLSCGFEGNDEV